MIPRRRSGTGGFTLLEIMIAVAILGSSLVILITNIYHSVKIYRVARDTLVAGFLAQEKFTELVNGKNPVRIGDYKDGRFEKAPHYRWRYRVEKVSLQPFIETVPGLKRLQVVVSWSQVPKREIEVISYVREPEPRGLHQ